MIFCFKQFLSATTFNNCELTSLISLKYICYSLLDFSINYYCNACFIFFNFCILSTVYLFSFSTFSNYLSESILFYILNSMPIQSLANVSILFLFYFVFFSICEASKLSIVLFSLITPCRYFYFIEIILLVTWLS